MDNLDIRDHLVHSLEELRELVGTPHEAVVKKSIAMIDDQARLCICGQLPATGNSGASGIGQPDV